MRALVLAYRFPPVGGAAAFRTVKLVKQLADFAYEPVVITTGDHAFGRFSPEDVSLSAEIPAGTVIHRVPGPEPGGGDGWRERGERWLGIEPAWARWWVEGVVSLAQAVAGDVDLVYANLDPYETARAAARLSAELGTPWVADLQDPWALDEMRIHPTRVHRRRDLSEMRRLLAGAAAIVMNTPEALRALRAELPELRHRPVFSIPNGFDEADFQPAQASPEGGPFTVVHTGTLHAELGKQLRRRQALRGLLGGMVDGLDVLTRSHVFLLEAVQHLIADDPRLAARLEIHLVGPLSAADREIGATCPVVKMPGFLPHRDTIALKRSADMLFLPMHSLPPGRRARIVPCKTYEYLASGRPILAPVPEGDARDLLSRAENVFLCDPDDAGAMAKILRRELRRPRRPTLSRAELLRPYERRRLTGELASVMDVALDGAPHGVLAA